MINSEINFKRKRAHSGKPIDPEEIPPMLSAVQTFIKQDANPEKLVIENPPTTSNLPITNPSDTKDPNLKTQVDPERGR